MAQEQAKPMLDRLHQRIATFNRESLPADEAVRQTTKHLEHKFSEELRRQYKERREIAESMNKIYAPLAEIVSKDPHALKEQRKLREMLAQRGKQKLTAPRVQTAHPMMASGSIVTLATPPYDFAWQWVDPNNTGRADAGADKFSGGFGGDATSYGGPDPSGYGQGGAGVGIAFHPIAAGEFLNVSYQLSYNVSWYENSNVDTAHTSGSSNLWIYQFDLGWNFQQVCAQSSVPIWSDGTSWFETHNGGTSVSESNTPSFFGLGTFLSSNHNYILWFFANWEADGAGDPNGPVNSQAQCAINASLPFVVLEQMF
jgi:hypothetical protein